MLLDTCSLLWLVAKDDHLTEISKDAIRNNQEGLYVSAISFFEIGVKVNKKLLQLPLEPKEWFENVLRLHHLTELPITSSIALLSTQLPEIHRDPADRMIIATAMQHNLTIITPDKHIHAYPSVKCLWN